MKQCTAQEGVRLAAELRQRFEPQNLAGIERIGITLQGADVADTEACWTQGGSRFRARLADGIEVSRRIECPRQLQKADIEVRCGMAAVDFQKRAQPQHPAGGNARFGADAP